MRAKLYWRHPCGGSSSCSHEVVTMGILWKTLEHRTTLTRLLSTLWERETETYREINSFLNAVCAWPCLLDTTVRLMCTSLQTRLRSENRQGHCLLLCIALPPNGYLIEEEQSRRFAAATDQIMFLFLENKLFLHTRDVWDMLRKMGLMLFLIILVKLLHRIGFCQNESDCGAQSVNAVKCQFYSVSRKYII